MVVIHYTGMRTAAEALARLTDPAAKVSSHYLIDEDGTVLRLVSEERRAWHAGKSFWKGETDCNAVSIGIELVNPGTEFGYRPFPDAQIEALIAVLDGIRERWTVPDGRIVAHSDVAPVRKRDPGELFDWRRLAAAGIGLWPEEIESAAPGKAELDRLLRRFGYADSSIDSIMAFQRHFHPTCLTGIADRQTRARLAALVKQAGLA